MYNTKPSFHLNPKTGNPGRCRAQLHECPFGSEDNHFGSIEEARSFYEDFASKLLNPKESVRFHFISDEEEVAFTEGDCAFLAREIHKRTGWPLVLASAKPASSIEELDWYHMAVRTPDGRIIDASGLSTEKDFLETWAHAPNLTELDGREWSRAQTEDRQFLPSLVKTANKIFKYLAN